MSKTPAQLCALTAWSACLLTLTLACNDDIALDDDGTTSSSSSTDDAESTSTGGDGDGDGDGEPLACECGPDELCVGRAAAGVMCGGPFPEPVECNFCEDPQSRELACMPRPPGCAADQHACDPACAIPVCGEALCSDACEGIVDVDLWCTGIAPCDALAQDCPVPERCLPYKLVDELDAPYVAVQCSHTPAGASVGQACTTTDLTTTFDADSCDIDSICWDLEPDASGYTGVCHELCPCEAGVCIAADPWSFSFVCEPSCAQGEPCELGQACTSVMDHAGQPTFVCLPA